MLTAVFAVALLSSTSGQAVSVIARAPAPAETRVADGGETRRICRYERATGSNLQQRVCRDRPVQSVQDQQTREFMRGMQRIRIPDVGAMPTPAGPNG